MGVIPNGQRSIISPTIGNLTFTPSSGSVTYYEARVFAEGGSTVLATKYLGNPNADPVTGLIKVNMLTTLNALSAGSYDVRVAAIGSGGTSVSAISNVFDVPVS